MENHFVTYEQALKLKELGFDEPCFGFYDNTDKTFYQIHSGASTNCDFTNIITKSPLKQQVFDWFRKKYRLTHNIFDCLDDYEVVITEWTLFEDKITYEFNQRGNVDYPYNRFDSYEDAESVCIDELIEIVKYK